MRIYISADIEGVAGVTHLPTTGPGRFEWDLGRKWMTEEVLAAMDGAIAAGATEFVVADGHGSAHNLLVDRLPPTARIVRSWPRPLLQMQGIEDGPVAAAVFIGHHASAVSSHGLLSHTFTGAFSDIRLNGVSQSETSLNALVAAQFGVPLVFTSGDEDYIRHCEAVLPRLETVVTKRCVGFTSANHLHPAASCAAIRAGVERALGQLATARPAPLPETFRVETDFRDRSQPEMLEYLPWVRRTGPFTVAAEFPDPVAMMKYLAFLSFYRSEGIPRYGEGVP
jgi:D-amino peptidase